MVKASCTIVVKFVKKVQGRMMYPAGIWNVNTAYVGSEQKAPYIYYEPGNTFYGLNKNTTVKGVNPATDYAANGKNASWIPFENFKALFIEILMALFAKLGSAVFWNDYMFSQHGVDANGNATNNYQNFDGLATKAFTPNFYVNFRTGKVYACDIDITGVINATLLYRKTVNASMIDISNLNPAIHGNKFYAFDGFQNINLPDASVWEGLTLEFITSIETRSAQLPANFTSSTYFSGLIPYADRVKVLKVGRPCSIIMTAMGGKWFVEKMEGDVTT